MGRSSVVLTGLVGVLAWTSSRGQDNETCTTESCGITTCNAGYELKVAIASDSLDISCEACDEGYYKPDDGAQSCTVCVEGLVAEVGSTLCALEEGFWRTSNVSDEIYGCPNLAACVGGYDEASYCDDAFEGPLCAVCTTDYYPSGSFECLKCSNANTVSTFLTIIIFLAVLGLFVVILSKASGIVEENARETNDYGATSNDAAAEDAFALGTNSKLFKFVKQWKDTLVVRFKIIVTHFQIITTFPAVLDVQWPESFNRYADKLSVINLNFWGILTQTCFFRSDFLKQLVFTTLLPLGIVAALVMYYFKAVKTIGSDPLARKAAWDNTAGGVLLTLFFFYIITSTLVLKSFDCQDFDNDSSYLKADYSISCDSETYDFIYGYSVVMAMVFPAGVPLTYIIVLYLGRQRINPEPLDPELSVVRREGDKTIQKTKFLWGTYRPSVYFYEVWECIRKLLLTGLLVYFEEGTSTQVVIAMLITLAGLRVLAGLRPYRREDENNLAEASLWVTFLTLFAGLLIKSQVAENDGYDTTALGVVLSLMNAGILGLAIFQILWTTSVWFKEKWSDLFRLSQDQRKPPRQQKTPYATRPTQAPASSAPRGQVLSPMAQGNNRQVTMSKPQGPAASNPPARPQAPPRTSQGNNRRVPVPAPRGPVASSRAAPSPTVSPPMQTTRLAPAHYSTQGPVAAPSDTRRPVPSPASQGNLQPASARPNLRPTAAAASSNNAPRDQVALPTFQGNGRSAIANPSSQGNGRPGSARPKEGPANFSSNRAPVATPTVRGNSPQAFPARGYDTRGSHPQTVGLDPDHRSPVPLDQPISRNPLRDEGVHPGSRA